MQYKTTERDPADLVKLDAPYNPRYISEGEMNALVESIKRFGFVEPVVLNTTTQRIVGGHQRIQAALRLGIKVPVMEIALDEVTEKLLNVALNRIKGKFDVEKLGAIFEELALAGEDTDITGFNPLEVAEIGTLLGDGREQEQAFPRLIVKVKRSEIGEVKDALKKAKQSGAFNKEESQNANGNALLRIAESYMKKE